MYNRSPFSWQSGRLSHLLDNFNAKNKKKSSHLWITSEEVHPKNC